MRLNRRKIRLTTESLLTQNVFTGRGTQTEKEVPGWKEIAEGRIEMETTLQQGIYPRIH